ncbi:hypothetical protein LDENG_00107800 [Lucifuga dentata]|nr:hypothetical protein LDENG_00107800 [Lucifuga dentata]
MDKEFPIHKIILCGCSQYFRSLFTRWSPKEENLYIFNNVSPGIMQLIIEFAYIGFVEVCQDNVQDLFVASDYFHVQGLIQACCTFIQQHLATENCIEVWQFAQNYFRPSLKLSAYLFIIRNFRYVCMSSNFLQLSVEELSTIIEKDQLEVKEESTVFEAVVRWIKHSPQERNRFISVLLPKVYICGGFNGNDCLSSAECYCPETDQWTLISPMSINRSGVGVITFQDHIFAVGGFDGEVRLNSAEAYNPRTNTWHAVPSMRSPRSNFGIEVIDDYLFVAGGYNGLTTIAEVELYDINAGEWLVAPAMEISRSALSCCVVTGLTNMADYAASRNLPPTEQNVMESEEPD